MTLKEQLGECWYNTPLKFEFTKKYMKRLYLHLKKERMEYTVYPSSENVFRAYRLTPPDKVKVVILGQDPYPHKAANGLCFSADESLESNPPSLNIIFKEVENDIGFQPYHNPDLGRWARQGVMLLNTTLTVRANQPGSHSRLGWKRFTNKTFERICMKEDPVVFLLWGREAHYYGHKIPDHHEVFYSSHPRFCTGFLGTKPFSRANEVLKENFNTKIDWLNNDYE